MLQELVKAGKLPPLEERLPEDPLICTPIEEIGQYGGTRRPALPGVSDYHAYGRVNYEPILRWPRDPRDAIQPGIASAWEFSEDGKVITLFLRKGIKWSDGQPLTAKDWQFWWQDMVLDEKINIGRQTGTFVKDKPMDLTLVDDYTLQLGFAAPNPLFIQVMSRGTGSRATAWQVIPAHYYKQFHYKYNTAYKDTDIKDLVDRYNNRMLYPEIPHFGPWLVKEYREAERAVAERNPYYWKVDPAGNQLPYIDAVEIKIVQAAELIPLSFTAAAVAFQIRQLDIRDIPLIMENPEKCGF